MQSEIPSTSPSRELQRAAEAALRAAEERGRSQWLRWRFTGGGAIDPLALFAAAREEPDRFYWERPSAGEGLCALGVLAVVEAEGSARFRDCARAIRRWSQDLHWVGERDGLAPLAVGGFGFEDETDGAATGDWDGFPAARMVLPRSLVEVRNGEAFTHLLVEAHVGAEAGELARDLLRQRDRISALGSIDHCGRSEEPASSFRAVAEESFDSFRSRVRAALSAIQRAELEKVVLARAIRIEHGDAAASIRLLEMLRRNYPSCVNFGIARDDALFLGASPERLVALRGSRVDAVALAGSVARGRDPNEDGDRIRALRESKKEQEEHAVVVRALRDELRPFCGEVSGPEAPQVLLLEGIAHLETPLSGEVLDSEDSGILELVEALHPTPAVAGAPRDVAREWLRDREPLERGWYASPVGYVDVEGGGEFRVALRCGLLRPGATRLFAGAGIVDGSDPFAELEETRIKFRTLLNPLLEV